MRLIRLWILTVTLLIAGVGHADTVTLFFTALPTTFENGTYNGFATAVVEGIPNESLICDDFVRETYVPSSSNLIYDYSLLTGANPLQHARFTGANETRNYQEAAVLVVGLTNYVAGGGATRDGITDYQYAIWNLFNPSAVSATAGQQALQASALAVVNAGGTSAANDYKRLVVYTPTAPYGSNQEFLGLDTPTPAPEPATLPLLAFLGMVIAAVSFRSVGMPSQAMSL